MLKPIIAAVSIAVAAAVFSHDSDVALLAAGPSQQHEYSNPAPAPATPQATTPDMRQMHRHMMSAMKAADAKLDGLMKDMNAATGEAKVSAMAQVVTELVRQQQAVHQRMVSMDHCTMMGGHGAMMKK